MTFKEAIEEQFGKQDFTLTDDEFNAVYDWVNAHKDEWDFPLKGGLLKLLNAEEHRRL